MAAPPLPMITFNAESLLTTIKQSIKTAQELKQDVDDEILDERAELGGNSIIEQFSDRELAFVDGMLAQMRSQTKIETLQTVYVDLLAAFKAAEKQQREGQP